MVFAGHKSYLVCRDERQSIVLLSTVFMFFFTGRSMALSRDNWKTRLGSSLRKLGPYAAIELLLPGGSLIALSLWAIRNRSSIAAHARHAWARRSKRPAVGLIARSPASSATR
jgi:hypothetical protein